jgi:hypothetical protein
LWHIYLSLIKSILVRLNPQTWYFLLLKVLENCHHYSYETALDDIIKFLIIVMIFGIRCFKVFHGVI